MASSVFFDDISELGVESLLAIHDLSIKFSASAKPVVSRFSLSIAPGECVGLVGESGSGKSLTALAIMQLLPVAARVSAASQALFNGQDLLNYSSRQMRQIRGAKIGMIFQDAMSAFNPVYTIGAQLIEIIVRTRKATKIGARRIAYELLNEVGMNDPVRSFASYPHQLSGGMRQRAMIAMALGGQPDLLIADEPTTALDVTTQAQVLILLQSLQKKHRMSLLFISHDLFVVSQLADRIVVMRQGEKVDETSTDDFFQQSKSTYTQQLLAAIPDIKPRYSPLNDAPTLLNIDQLKVYFPIRKGLLKRKVGDVKAVDDVSLTIASGETLALVGESGSGKTTLAKAVINLVALTAGSIQLNGKSRLNPFDLQMIFQDPYSALNPRLMIFDAISEGLLAQKKVRNQKEAVDKVNYALQQVDLSPDMKWRYPHELSGGQRQRICIARALVLAPKLLILDEPTSALDVSIQMQILNLLEKLQKELGLSYLLITHNLSIVAHMAHRMAVMHQGKVVEQGPVQSVLSRPQHTYTRQLIASIPVMASKGKAHEQ